jgi:predicted ATP-grasp superfamily ATP-dependent carboligase
MILRLSEPGMNQVVTDAIMEQVKDNQVVTDAIMEQVKDIDKEIEKNMGEIANLMSTPVKSNRTPPNWV